MKIGVFDSGRGGKYVADRLQVLFPDDDVHYVNDVTHLPYGEKTATELQQLTDAAIQPLLEDGSDVIVIACNSATTNAIAYLRQNYPATFFVGIEPMIKPAAQLTTTNTIAVCATPATLRSEAYASLKQRYASELTVIEPDCATWASLIEDARADEIDVEATVHQLHSQGCDTVVLGCTHYHYLKDRFQKAAPLLHILEPTDAIASRIAAQITTIRSRQR